MDAEAADPRTRVADACVPDPFAGAIDALTTARAAWMQAGSTFEGMPQATLVAVNDRLGRARRLVDAAVAAMAAEITRQSRPDLGRAGLARQQGYRTPVQMLAATGGVTPGDAARLVSVGQAVAARTALTGEPLPPKHPHVAQAVTAGRIGTWAAGQIVRMLDRVRPHADPDAADRMEALLASRAPGLSSDQVSKLVLQAETQLNPDGLQDKLDELRCARSLRIRQDPTGAVCLTATLDPESGAYVKTALEGLVTASYRTTTTGIPHLDDTTGTKSHGTAGYGAHPDGTTGPAALLPVAADDRSTTQRYADALTDLCRHALGCDAVPFAHPATTVIVRMTLTDLQTDTGQATIDGIDQPVDTTTARRMAASGGIIPTVLDADGDILDWGRTRRLFTTAQRLALAERDHGCAFCGLPPAWCEAHHIHWWDRDHGPTDLDNGILLCTRCHHRIHDDGWQIHITGHGTTAHTWFTPPTHIDPTRTPRPGGPHRHGLTTDTRDNTSDHTGTTGDRTDTSDVHHGRPADRHATMHTDDRHDDDHTEVGHETGDHETGDRAGSDHPHALTHIHALTHTHAPHTRTGTFNDALAWPTDVEHADATGPYTPVPA